MIIIDENKYETLKRGVTKQRVSDEMVPDDNSFYMYKELIAGKFQVEVRHRLGIELSSNQIEVRHTESDPNRHTKDFEVFFKPNRRHIALWDDIEKTIAIPLNFTPPFAVQVPLREPRVEKFGQTEALVPYDVLQYWPWGYDLERNVQVWKKR